MTDKASDWAQWYFRRVDELTAEGRERDHASAIAQLETRIDRWPPEWGNTLRVVIYGDFQAPATPVEIASLRIRIETEELDRAQWHVLTAIPAVLAVDERSIAAISDVYRRMNLLLGVHFLREWGSAAVDWWCHVTHPIPGGVIGKPFDEDLEEMLKGISTFPEAAQRHIRAALFWVRGGREMFMSNRSDTLRYYSGLWSAFERLVDAVCLIRPMTGVSPAEKQAAINEFFKSRTGPITAELISRCYNEIVSTSLRKKAMHALSACFGDDRARRYARECFGPPKKASLSSVRNAIDHGFIDLENVNELYRVEGRMRVLWVIVWQMFARLMPLVAPAA